MRLAGRELCNRPFTRGGALFRRMWPARQDVADAVAHQSTVKRRAALATVAGTLAAAAFPARAQTLETVTVGAVNSVADTPFLIADRKGFFHDVGIDVKFQTFDSGASMIAPIGTGQIDVAGGAPAAGLYNAIARGINMKIVADRASDPPGYGFNVLLVRKDLVTSGRYKTLADLKGMKFAEPGKGSTSLATTERLLQKAGLKYDDVEHVFLAFPEQVVALQNGSIDATCVLEPWATQAVKLGIATRIGGDDTWYPNQQLAVVLYSVDFATKRLDAANRFMVAYVRALRYYNDALSRRRHRDPRRRDETRSTNTARDDGSRRQSDRSYQREVAAR
jgi:NitT/TauT family transport system substrate-binding protein